MTKLLTPQDTLAYRQITGSEHIPLLLVCDHASNAVPIKLGDLGGVSPEDMQRHIAWDPGAARVTELMAQELGCYAILGGYSRLVVDCNRFPDDPEFIVKQSDGTVIPVNQNVSEQDRIARRDELFLPYQDAIADRLQKLDQKHTAVGVVAIHSFTPQMQGKEKRPWHIGVVWNKDEDTATSLIDYLRKIPDIIVGDNQPYSMKTHSGYTLEHHAEGKRPSVLIEIRNDLISDEAGCVFYAHLLAKFFAARL